MSRSGRRNQPDRGRSDRVIGVDRAIVEHKWPASLLGRSQSLLDLRDPIPTATAECSLGECVLPHESLPACKAFAQGLEAERGALALRPLFGLCDLLKRHGNERVERVCALALSTGTFRLRFLRKALDVETIPSLLDEDRIIELISTYQAHFSTLTQGVASDDKL